MASFIDNAIRLSNGYSDEAKKLIKSANTVARGRAPINWQDLKFNQDLVEPNYPNGLPRFIDYYNAPQNTSIQPVFKDLFLPDEPLLPDQVVINTNGLFLDKRPDYNIGRFDKTVPNIDITSLQQEIDGIQKPNVLTIPIPAIADITVRDAPQVVLPFFDTVFTPTNAGDVPDIVSQYRTEYDNLAPAMRDFVDNNVDSWINQYAPDYHKNLSQLQDKLNAHMDSGKALSDDFEAALYNRARSRTEKEQGRVESELLEGMGKRGFDLPPSAVSAGLQNIHQSTADSISIQSLELAIERGRQEIQHVQFCMSLSQGVQQMLVGNSLQYANILTVVNGQSLQYAGQIAQSMVQVYELGIQRANLEIAVYQIEGQIYEIELKSALAQLDEIKLEIDVARLRKDIEAIDVDLYTKRIDAENTKIEQTLALLKIVSEKAQLEKLKIELFGEEVKGFVATVQGKTAEFDGFQSSVDADKAILSGENLKLDNYSKQVDAEGNKQRVQISRMDATNGFNRNLIDQYGSELDTYKTEIGAESSRYDASLKGRAIELDEYQTEINVQLDTFKVKLQKAKLDLDASTVQFQGNQAVSITNAEHFMEHIRISADNAQAGAKQLTGMAASALGSQNSMDSRSEQV